MLLKSKDYCIVACNWIFFVNLIFYKDVIDVCLVKTKNTLRFPLLSNFIGSLKNKNMVGCLFLFFFLPPLPVCSFVTGYDNNHLLLSPIVCISMLCLHLCSNNVCTFRMMEGRCLRIKVVYKKSISIFDKIKMPIL